MANTLPGPDGLKGEIERARQAWREAALQVTELELSLFQPGSGYGDPEARQQDEHRLASARRTTDERFREYDALSRERTDSEILRLQRSQSVATWASFAVAVAVSIATILQTILFLMK